jgi:glycosyltransferase involved in cell wall biosynthesis
LIALHYPDKYFDEKVLKTEKILIDVTNTRKQPYTTGIQRVVRNLCRSTPDSQLIYFDPEGRARTTNGSSPKENRVSNANIKLVLYGTKLWHLIFNTNEEGNRFAFLQPMAVKIGDPIRTVLLKSSRRLASLDMPLDVSYSHLIIAEVPTNSSHVDALMGLARSGRMKTTVLLHDLIPLVHPELTPTDPRHIFLRFLQFICNADRVICISGEVERQYLKYVEMQPNKKAGQEVLVLEYPEEPKFESSEGTINVEGIDGRIGFNSAQSRFFLAVGTLTRRKNLGLIVQAMDYLDGPYSDVKLVMVGRKGFDSHYIDDELLLSLGSQDKVRILEGVTDAELQYLITNSAGILFPSVAEGYGLPIIEATAAKKKIVVSDIEPMRSIGHSFGAVVRPANDILGWCEAMLEILSGEESVSNHKANRNLSWESWAEIVTS